MPAFSYPLRIRFVDTDASGRIHYSALMRHFEVAETEFFRAIGHPYADISSRDDVYPRVHVEADYLLALRSDDEVEIEVAVERVGGKSFTLAFTVRRDGAVAAKGRIVAACMDRRTQKSRPLPEDFAAVLRAQMA
jgi:YbgC/YbaW family acyl-CoA thioester hydrolase